MPVTKITPLVAMRARDVSRPQAEHLAAAAEREDGTARPPEAPGAAAPGARPTPPEPGLSPPIPAPPRRRRRRGR